MPGDRGQQSEEGVTVAEDPVLRRSERFAVCQCGVNLGRYRETRCRMAIGRRVKKVLGRLERRLQFVEMKSLQPGEVAEVL